VLSKNFPFFFGWAPWFVQNFRRNGELADIVQKRSPTQAVEIFFGELEFHANSHGPSSDPFGVAACPSVMVVQQSDEAENLFGSYLGVFVQAMLAKLFFEGLVVPYVSTSKGSAHPRRCSIGKGKGEFQQRCQGNQPPRKE
jgi:hypothetical protein